MKMKYKVISLASIIACCGIASSAVAQSLFESPLAPSAGVFQSQLVGGSTSGSPGASSQDYLNALNPSQTFSVSSAQSLASVTFRGNGDAGYYTPNGAPDVASAIFDGYSGGLSSVPGLVPLLTWDIQIGSVSGGVITPIDSESVTGFAPTSSSDFLSFNLSHSIALAPGTTYEFSLTFDTSTLNDFGGPTAGSVWYGMSESLVPEAGGAAFDNGTVQGIFANNGVTSFDYSYVYELSSSPVPEPATLALMGFGALGALMGLRHRRA